MSEACNNCEYKEKCKLHNAEDTDNCEQHYAFSANEYEDGVG